MSRGTILYFDSGIGGLSVVKEARVLLPEYRSIYVADDAAFPYGDWEEAALHARLLDLFGRLLDEHDPDLVVIACNTASTLAIASLRERFPDEEFVGTVPAIKPAAERTKSGLVSVLATPGTVEREYTHDLIARYASKVDVRLVGSDSLARLAEGYMRTGFVDESAVRAEIEDCFVEEGHRRTDIVVLACTHYPFLVNRMRKVAPWPVDWIDTSEAIARRALTVIGEMEPTNLSDRPDRALFTSGDAPPEVCRLLGGFGFEV